MNHEEMLLKDFKDHQASMVIYTAPNITNQYETLTWMRPGTTVCGIIYTISHGYLIVRGDMGNAMYQVSGKQDFAFWAGTDLHYFKSKCVCSEQGRGYEWNDWCEATCKASIMQHFKDYKETPDVELLKEVFDVAYSRDEYTQWLRDYGSEFLGTHWHDCEPWDWGNITPIRCRAHHMGLKLAWAQLKKGVQNAEAAEAD